MSVFSTGFASENDKDALVELQAAVGGGYATKEDFEHWYLDHPFGEVTIPVVRAADDSLVGAAWIFPLRLSVGGRDLEMAAGANLHIRPEYQDTFAYPLLSRHLTRTIRKRTPAHFSLVSPRTFKRQRSADPDLAASLPWLIRVLDPALFAKRYGPTGLRRLGSPLVRTAARALFRPTGTGAAQAQIQVRTLPEFDERFDALWRALRPHYPITPVRSADYLRWRFGGQSLRLYEIFVAEASGRTFGYLVLRTMQDGEFRQGYIADLLLAAGVEGAQAGRALLRAVEEHARARGLALLSTVIQSRSEAWRLLVKAGYRANPVERIGRMGGFWPAPLRGALFIHDADAISAATRRVRDWYMTLASHETI